MHPNHQVSIHAPAKGATICRGREAAGKSVSIHAPAKGATTAILPPARTWTGFDPRPREGGDSCFIRFATYTGVSIHAPAKGAT